MDLAWHIKGIKRLQPIPAFVLTSHLDKRTQITSEISKVNRLIRKPIEGRRSRTYLREVSQITNNTYEPTNEPQTVPTETTQIG